jgi:hypothetical protein
VRFVAHIAIHLSIMRFMGISRQPLTLIVLGALDDVLVGSVAPET